MNLHSQFFLIFLTLLCYQCNSQKSGSLIGGPCEGCEAAVEYGNRPLSSTDTIPGFKQNEPKIKIYGTVFEKDNITPARDVILYMYHTNRSGIYYTSGEEKGWGRRHGIHRTWLKTDENGFYSFYTFRPGAYPDRNEPEHIHLTVKEKGKNPYFMSDYLFDDDPLLTEDKREGLRERGGHGIISLTNDGPLKTARRDIILGLNIPNYR